MEIYDEVNRDGVGGYAEVHIMGFFFLIREAAEGLEKDVEE